MKKLWGNAFKKKPGEKMVKFCSGKDTEWSPPADSFLFKACVQENAAHAKMLNKIGILSDVELAEALGKLESMDAEDFGAEYEDIQTYVETKLGKVGEKVHAGRSRNDQIVTDTRLYLKEQCTEFLSEIAGLQKAIKNKEGEKKTTIPGYTHYQKAMPVSFGEWLMSYWYALERNAKRFESWQELYDECPLGAAAGFGTSLPVDREYTAELLGFSRVQENSMDCVKSRTEQELDFVHCVACLMNTLSNMAQDFIILGTEEFGVIEIPEEYCTGSSIMPQKKNPDALEAFKGKAACVHGCLVTLLSLSKGNFGAYNRDSQYGKYALIEAIEEAKPCPGIMAEIVKGIKVNEKKEPDGELLATFRVEKLVLQGTPFREAKKTVEKSIKHFKSGRT
jgi:argininosuccinate lyase